MVWGSIPIQAQNWIQQMACIRSGRCMVVFKILLIIFTASDLVSESLSPYVSFRTLIQWVSGFTLTILEYVHVQPTRLCPQQR